VHLHHVGDSLAFGQYLGEVLGAENVAQGGLREQAGRVVRVLNVRYRHRRVAHSIVDDSVHRNCHRIFCQHLVVINQPIDINLQQQSVSYKRSGRGNEM